MTGFAVSFLALLSHSCSCGGWDLGQALGILFLIPFKSCLSCKVQQGQEKGEGRIVLPEGSVPVCFPLC